MKSERTSYNEDRRTRERTARRIEVYIKGLVADFATKSMTGGPASRINGIIMVDSYLCSVCGKSHEGIPSSWGPDAPDMWAALPVDGREDRGEVGTDQAVIDESHFYIRGRVEIPVVETGDLFTWLLWVEVSPNDFLSMSDLWTVDGR
jgi:hypothetical protein